MSQNAPRPAPLFDPASVVARDYERIAVVALALWCMIGVLLMFAGTALLDTSGLGLTVAETALLLVLDRRGFYTAAGLFPVDRWNQAQRALLSRVLTWAVVIFLAFYLFTQPDGAANVIRGMLDLLRSAGNVLAIFVNHL